MTLNYGFLKCHLSGSPKIKASRRKRETQYHMHVETIVQDQSWDVAINVGTDEADDLLNYRLIYDYRGEIQETLKNARLGFTDLTGTKVLPALDFLRSPVLDGTGPWRMSDVMDGSDLAEPVASLKRLLGRAIQSNADVYLFGRTYRGGDKGIHDIHFNQGSGGGFVNDGEDDDNDHNDIWQDGAVLVDLGDPGWAGYFTAFTQQRIPTDDLGNAIEEAKPIT